jgi:hypothetical protein
MQRLFRDERKCSRLRSDVIEGYESSEKLFLRRCKKRIGLARVEPFFNFRRKLRTIIDEKKTYRQLRWSPDSFELAKPDSAP